jgi:hypothetical protein
MPECYRTYGPFWNRRLLVLWGFEYKEGASIDPNEAVKKLASRIDRGAWIKKLLAALLAAALLLLLVGAGWWVARHLLGRGVVPAPDANKPTSAAATLDANRVYRPGGDANVGMVPSGDPNRPPISITLPTGTNVVGVLTSGHDANTLTIRLVRPDGSVVNTEYSWDWLRRYKDLLVLLDPLTRNFVPTGPLTIDPAYRDWAGAARLLEEVAWSVEIKSEIVGGQYVLTAQLSPDIADLKVIRWIVGGAPQVTTANSIRIPVGQETSVEVWAETPADPGRTIKQTIQIGKK